MSWSGPSRLARTRLEPHAGCHDRCGSEGQSQHRLRREEGRFHCLEHSPRVSGGREAGSQRAAARRLGRRRRGGVPGRSPGEVGRLVHRAGALVLNEYGQAEVLPVPRRLDREREPLRRGRFAVELDELIFRLPSREARDQRLARVLARRDVGDDAVLAEHGADQERRLLGPGRPARHLGGGRAGEPVRLEREVDVERHGGFPGQGLADRRLGPRRGPGRSRTARRRSSSSAYSRARTRGSWPWCRAGCRPSAAGCTAVRRTRPSTGR